VHNIEKYDQSISAGIVCSVYYRLGETVTWRSIKCNVNWPGLVKRSQEDLSAVGCRLSSHYKPKALAKVYVTLNNL